MSIDPAKIQIYATASLSFGIGDAQLTYGEATGLIVVSTGLEAGRNPGVAGFLTVGASAGIGLPGIGSLFQIKGSVSVMFNTTLQEQTFKIPDAFLPLLKPGEPTTITIHAAAPGLDGKKRPNAPPGGEVYASATIAAEISIGPLSLNGFIQIQAGVGPSGGRLAVTGAVGMQVPFIGSFAGTLFLEITLTPVPVVAGRIHLTLGANSIPGVRFNGEFLLEINTSSAEKTIQTFRIKKDAQGVFAGFEKDAAGNLVVTSQTLSVVAGFRLTMAGKLVILDTLEVSGRVDFSVQLAGATPSVELIVNGNLAVGPIGGIALTNSGFRITGEGLVARVEVSIGVDFGRDIGLEFSVSGVLALNTTSRTQTLGTSIVERGFKLRIQGDVKFLDFATGNGFVEVSIGPEGFTLLFGIGFDLGGLSFRADGGATVVTGGFALRLNIRATADADVFLIDASGTLQINTTSSPRLGVAANTFVLELTGKVEILKVIKFDASMRVVVGAGGWSFNASASMDFFGIARLGGSIFLDSKGNFDIQLRGEMVLGSRSFGLIGTFNFRVRSQSSIVNANPYYVFELSGSARVEARVFGITLAGLGLGFSFRAEGAGRVKIELSVTVEIDLLLVTIKKTARFTIGYLELPRPVYLGGQESAQQTWVESGGVLHLNVGDRAAHRNLATDEKNEGYLIEQLSGDGDKATIKVSGFGRSNIYSNVTRIVGAFGDGDDFIRIADGVLVPVEIDAGSNEDVVVYAGSNGSSKLEGGADNDYVELLGAGAVWAWGDEETDAGVSGNDVIVHNGTGKATIRGGGGDDRLFGSTKLDELYGDGGKDLLVGPALVVDGGAGDDTIQLVLTTDDPVTIDGGAGVDRLEIVATDTPDTFEVSKATIANAFVVAVNTTDRDVLGVEDLLLDGRAGADTFVVRDLGSATGLTSLRLDLGRLRTVNGTKIVKLDVRNDDGSIRTFDRVVPNETISDDGAADSVLIEGGSIDDRFALSTAGGVLTAARSAIGGSALYSVLIGQGVRAEGDGVTVDGAAGDDQVDAEDVTANLAALTLMGSAGNDTLFGTGFQDVLDGGDGNDTYTGGDALDTFFDSGGTDTLIEAFDRDMGLFENIFLVGRVASPPDGTPNATEGSAAIGLPGAVDTWIATTIVEEIKGIFEFASLTGGDSRNIFVVGDVDGRVTVGTSGIDVRPWRGDVTLDTKGRTGLLSELVVINAEGAAGARVHVIDTGTSDFDELVVNGTAVGELVILDVLGGPTRGSAVITPAAYGNTIEIDFRGVERMTLSTLGGDDKVGIRRVDVDTRVLTGNGADDVAVGTNAGGGTTFTNTGGTLDDIDALLSIVGGAGVNTLSIDDGGDTSDNAGTLTATRISGLDTAAGVNYLGFDSLAIALGSGSDTFTIESTHAGPGRSTSVTGADGDDTINVRTIDGPTTIDTGAGTDTVRIGSLASAAGGVLSGIRANVEIAGGSGSDSVFVDDTGTTADRIGVLTPDLLAGLGMVLGGSAPAADIPSLVQVVEVANAVDGRFRLTVDGVAFTDELDFDASADKVRIALEGLPQIGAGDVAVTKAGTRWTIAYRGALAGAAGRALAPLALAQSALFPLVARPGGPAVATAVLGMTDGRVHYTGFEAMTLDLGQGRDVLNVDGTLTGTTTVNGGGGGDRVMVETTGGATRVNGQGGDDWLLVNALPALPDAVNRISGQLTLDGGGGSDTTVVGLFGEGDTTIAVIDTGFDGGTNALVVNGSAADDQFLFRAGLIALLTRDAGATTGPFAHAEKVTYTNAITGGVQVNGRAGDDSFAFDDTSSLMSVNGDGGNDFFQVGQLFTSYVPDLLHGIAPPSFANTTRGLLSPGVSYATVMNGGTGDDSFMIFRNRGALQLNGEAGDDTFIIRTFIDVDKSTNVNSGTGRDFIQYVANAPVSVDGGDGYDTVVVVGTEVRDTFVVTAQGIWGAGRFIAYLNVEKLIIEGMEGDDLFYVLSTNPNVETAIYGGLGSDTINVAADVRNTIGTLVDVPAVQANDLLGHSGLLSNSVESTSGMWVGVPVDGIGAEIVDNDAPAVILTPLVGTLTVSERGDGAVSYVTYTAALAFQPNSDVEITIGTPIPSPSAEAIRSKSVLLSLDGIVWRTSVTLTFTPAGFATAQQIFVMADFDLSSERERVVPLMAMVVGQVGGTAAGGTDTTLVAGTSLFAGRSLTGLEVVITAGTGAGQVRRIASHTGDTLTVAAAWDTAPTTNSSFLIRGLGDYENLQLPITGIRVLDDEQAGVVITELPGGTNVIEGGTTTYQVALTRPPLAQVTVTLTSDGQVWIGSPAVAPAGPVFTVVFAAGDVAPKTVTVKGRPDATVEGFHFGYVDHAVAANDTFTGTVAGSTGRMDEFYAAVAVADGQLRGMLVRIVSGAGAGQIRPIWTNANTTLNGQAVNLVVVQGDWDVKPDTTSGFEITGYQSAGSGVPEATVATLSVDRTTITFALPAGAAAPAPGSLVGATIRLATGTGADFFRTIVANTATSITVGDAWGSSVTIAAGTPFAVLDMPGITIDRVAPYIADADTRTVIVRESGGATRVVEGGTYDTYTVRLTQAPAPGETVTIRIAAQNTPTLDAAIGQASLRNNRQLVVSATPGGAYELEIVLTFDEDDWDDEKTVYVKALDDAVADGGDLQAFPDRAQRVNLVQGPLYVGGGTNENATYNLDLSTYLPVLLPGEASGNPLPITNPSAQVVELNQVDTLNVFNNDSPGADAGQLTSTRLTGLGMGPDTVIAGRKLNGGISYGEAACATSADQDCLEAVNIRLGYGPDTFRIVSTHRGTTALWAGRANDTIDVLTLAGHTALFGDEGDDLVRVGTGVPAGPSTIDQIVAHLSFDGGAGFDRMVVDDRADTDANLGLLTQTTITGLASTWLARRHRPAVRAAAAVQGAENITMRRRRRLGHAAGQRR